ncbi:hypothetical protein [Phosphitispora fastidiosa]|uniref:hypothetical protein n=1 Tax=Phosphitispora fastidiosa TaxID=2837202 RepID=UPI001E64E5DA|nr:hypothetical protein [Phosphitispora fastidiosa]MBU7005945.1 hypothetical protein [Phosphitispora fastidiosa]
MTIFLLIIVFTGIIALETPAMLKKRQWRELAAFGVLMLGGMALTFAQALGLPLPNPTTGIEVIFSPVADMIKDILS